ncbi:MAG: hypothetical protein ABJF23_14885, partial [Bryobacteraceae bacterium]
MAKASRQTVDLSGYPDMVVVYLGMRVNTLTGLKTMFGFGPKIENSVSANPTFAAKAHFRPNPGPP